MEMGNRSRRGSKWSLAVAALVLVGAFFAFWPAPEPEPRPAPRVLVEQRQNPQPRARARQQRPPVRLVPALGAVDEAASNGALEGRVISWTSAQGIADAELTFAHEGAAHVVISKADGYFKFLPPELGRYELAAATAEGFLPFAPQWGHSPVSFQARPESRVSNVTVYLVPATAYQGTVLAPDGSPVQGAEVWVRSERAESLSLVSEPPPMTSDAQGRVTLHAANGSLVEASHSRFAPGRTRLGFSAQVSRTFEIRLRPVDTRATSALRIAGHVQTAQGEPIAGALVTAQLHFDNPASPEAALQSDARTTSDPEGRFAITGLTPGRYLVVGRHTGYAPTALPAVAAGELELEIRLRPGGVIKGQVVNADTDAPIPAFAVVVARARPTPRRRYVTTRSIFDAGGSYEVRDLEPGNYELRVAAFGYAAADEVRVKVPAPPSVATADFRLSKGGRVFGRVVDEETSEPLARARVSCEGSLAPNDIAVPIAASTLTDDRGDFELAGIATGLRSIMAAADGHHGRLISALDIDEGGDVGPVEISLAPVAEGETPKLELTGIGAVLAPRGDGLVIGRVLPGGGAAEVGLGPDDAIVAIEGDAVTDLEFREAIERIRGPENSTIRLSVRRGKSSEVVEINVPRRRVRS